MIVFILIVAAIVAPAWYHYHQKLAPQRALNARTRKEHDEKIAALEAEAAAAREDNAAFMALNRGDLFSSP